jgi:kynurenine formamidase
MTTETAEWIASLGVSVVGADAIALEPVPPVSERLGEVHATFLCRQGIYCVININLEPMTRRGVWQFAFGCGPIPFTGAQGSPVRPFGIV